MDDITRTLEAEAEGELNLQGMTMGPNGPCKIGDLDEIVIMDRMLQKGLYPY